MDKALAREALGVATSGLDTLGVRWWIDCGTLLGAIREGDFLDHDQDIDISTWDWERSHEISGALLAAGFVERMTFGVPEHGYEQSYLYAGLKLDIFYAYRTGPTYWQGSWLYDHLIVSEFPTAAVAETKRREFVGLEVPIPGDPEAVLAARYGDWREIVKVWDWSRDPRCITADTHPERLRV